MSAGPAMSFDDALAFVQSSSRLLNLPLDSERARRVALHLQRTADIAQALETFELPPEIELAEIFCPNGPVASADQ